MRFFFFSLFFLASTTFVSCDFQLTESTPEFAAEDTIEQTPTIEYGIVTDSFEIHKGTIKSNQFLADILLGHNVPYPDIANLVAKAKEIFDVRKIVPGKPYSVYCSKDSLGKAQCMVYEASKTEYIVFDFRDSIHVYKGEKEVETRIREASGVITSSLYESLMDAKVSAALAMELSEIYAWTIDFYRIQKGDYFKVIFEEQFVEGEFVAIGKIHGALFNNLGENIYAIPFKQNSKVDFYDEKGNGLRKAFLQAPLKFSRISSGFSGKRFHPVQKRWKAHLGTDYAAPTGTPILAVGDGVVTESQYKSANGNYVKIKHNSTYTTQYLHMSKRAVKAGERVRQGQVIGYVGSTGLATGPHVCFRFWKNGQQVDHRKEKLPKSDPVKPENKAAFDAIASKIKAQLDAILLESEKLPA